MEPPELEEEYIKAHSLYNATYCPTLQVENIKTTEKHQLKTSISQYKSTPYKQMYR